MASVRHQAILAGACARTLRRSYFQNIGGAHARVVVDLQFLLSRGGGFLVRVLGRQAPVQKQLPEAAASLRKFPVNLVRNGIIDPGPHEHVAVNVQRFEPWNLIAQGPFFDDWEWRGGLQVSSFPTLPHSGVLCHAARRGRPRRARGPHGSLPAPALLTRTDVHRLQAFRGCPKYRNRRLMIGVKTIELKKYPQNPMRRFLPQIAATRHNARYTRTLIRA